MFEEVFHTEIEIIGPFNDMNLALKERAEE